MERRRVALDSNGMCKVMTERQRYIRKGLERNRFFRLPLLQEQETDKLIPNLVYLVTSDLFSLKYRDFHDSFILKR
jgi:hypothetical protein